MTTSSEQPAAPAYDKVVVHGMMHLRSPQPKTTFPTGECGTMGEELRVTDDLSEVTCPQCRSLYGPVT